MANEQKPLIKPGFQGLREPTHSETRDSIKTILAALEADKPRIQYSFFVQNYLPLLATPPEVDQDGFTVPRRLDAWLEVCKTPSNSVLVYDDNDPNKIVIEVPALIPEFSPILPERGQSMFEWSKDLEYDRTINPAYADNRFNAQVERRYGRSVSFLPEHAQAWDAFIVAHGYPSLSANPLDYQNQQKGDSGESGLVSNEKPTMTLSEDDFEDL